MPTSKPNATTYTITSNTTTSDTDSSGYTGTTENLTGHPGWATGSSSTREWKTTTNLTTARSNAYGLHQQPPSKHTDPHGQKNNRTCTEDVNLHNIPLTQFGNCSGEPFPKGGLLRSGSYCGAALHGRYLMVLASAQLRARPERKDGGHPALCNAPPQWLRMRHQSHQSHLHRLQPETFHIAQDSPCLTGNSRGGTYDLSRGNIIWPTTPTPTQTEQLTITILHNNLTHTLQIQTPPLHMQDLPTFITLSLRPFHREITRMPTPKHKAILKHIQHLGISTKSAQKIISQAKQAEITAHTTLHNTLQRGITVVTKCQGGQGRPESS